jgi:hypothetical protein
MVVSTAPQSLPVALVIPPPLPSVGSVTKYSTLHQKFDVFPVLLVPPEDLPVLLMDDSTSEGDISDGGQGDHLLVHHDTDTGEDTGEEDPEPAGHDEGRDETDKDEPWDEEDDPRDHTPQPVAVHAHDLVLAEHLLRVCSTTQQLLSWYLIQVTTLPCVTPPVRPWPWCDYLCGVLVGGVTVVTLWTIVATETRLVAGFE